MPDGFMESQIIVVDDESIDKTAEEARLTGAEQEMNISLRRSILYAS